jgi:hypothetical protein
VEKEKEDEEWGLLAGLARSESESESFRFLVGLIEGSISINFGGYEAVLITIPVNTK